MAHTQKSGSLVKFGLVAALLSLFSVELIAQEKNEFIMLYQLSGNKGPHDELRPMKFTNLTYEYAFDLDNKKGRKTKPRSPVFFGAESTLDDVVKESTSRKNKVSADYDFVINRIEKLGGRVLRDYTIVDVERYDVSRHASQNELKENRDKYLEIMQTLKARLPQNKLGYYGLPIIRNYGGSISEPGSRKYIKWQERNDVMQPLADTLDVFYPSMYTFYKDENSWKKYAKAHIAESRRLARKGQKVIVFLWPSYHNASKHKGTKISYSFWLKQLEICFQYADGVIIWNKSTEKGPFVNDDWYHATHRFIREKLVQGVKINPGL